MTELDYRVRVVYVGKRRLVGGKVGYWYQYVYLPPGVPVTGDGFGMTKPLVTGHAIGTLIEVTRVGTKTYTGGEKGPKVIGIYGSDTERAAWQLEHEMATADATEKAATARLAREAGKPLDEAVSALADIVTASQVIRKLTREVYRR
jgi:hypothetical protein